MITLIPNLPDNVVGIRGSGEITASDYEAVLIPAVENAFSKHARVRLLYALENDVNGYTAGAAWEDAKVGMKHLTSWSRVAVVTDIEWIERAVKAMAFTIPCEVQVYKNENFRCRNGLD
ncbi:MAG: STAS/SEC14 domain-containing protein [Polyangiales bacterium]